MTVILEDEGTATIRNVENHLPNDKSTQQNRREKIRSSKNCKRF